MTGGRAKGDGEGVRSTVERRTATERGVTGGRADGDGEEVGSTVERRTGATKEVRSGGGGERGSERGSERGVKCNILILSGLRKRGVSKTGTPLLCNRLYFNVLHFTLEIGSGAGTVVGGTGAEGKDGARRGAG